VPCGDKVSAFRRAGFFVVPGMRKNIRRFRGEKLRLWSDAESYGIKVVRVSEPAPAATIDSPENALGYWRSVIERKRWFDASKEIVVVILLSTRYDVQAYSLVSIGSMNESIAHPREIFRPAVACGSFAIVLMHNHPSGNPAPSHSDRSLSERVQRCGELLQIRMLDHVIVGDGNNYWSWEESGKETAVRLVTTADQKLRRSETG
jgi:hypothetical protein